MTKQVQRRRGTDTQHTSFTGAEGELSVNTSNKSIHVHDGSTAGGIETARADLGNVSDADLNSALTGNTLSSLTITSADINGGTIDGTVIGGTTPAAGNFTTGSFTGNATFGDNDKAIFGAGSDLQIYHDGSNSFIKDLGTGSLFLEGQNHVYIRGAGDGSTLARFTQGAQSEIYHAGTKTLNTTSTGIDVTGTVTADGLTVDGNVGIGTSSPSAKLHVASGGSPESLELKFDTGAGATSANFVDFNHSRSAGNFTFSFAGTERMRIDASGNLLVGKTAVDGSVAGIELGANDYISVTRASGIPCYLNRATTDGTIIEFRKDNTTVGSIGTRGEDVYLETGNTGIRMYDVSDAIIPVGGTGISRDGAIDLGLSNVRFNDIYATNGTIQTSDRNEKQDIDVLNAAEARVAVACKGLLRKFRWKDAVAEKGDDARIHFGIIAQDLQDAFTAEGLDAGRYAMFISSTWWETQTDVPAVEAVEAVEATYDEDGNELTPAVEAVEAKEAYTRTDTYETLEEAPEGATERTRLGVRYPELLAFIIAAI